MSSSEVGANFANIENYKCSIKEITVSTEWSTPGELTSGTAVGMAFDCQKKEGRKTFYVVTSPKGKKIALKTVRNAGRCQREAHGMYKKTWDEYVVNEKQIVYVPDNGGSAGSSFSPNNQCRTRENSVPWLSFVYDNVHLSNRFPIRESEQLTVKCFEIGGALGALNYFKLPIPVSPKQVTTFNFASCKDSGVGFDIVTYPDVRFKIELTVGTGEAKKKTGGWSHFKSESMYLHTAKEKVVPKTIEAFGTKIKFYPPRVDAMFMYNGKKDELGITLDFDTKNEVLAFHYKHDSFNKKFGSKGLQMATSVVGKIEDLCDLIVKICTMDFMGELKKFDPNKLRAYCPFQFEVEPTEFCLSVEGQYQTSRDMLRIGKIYDIGLAAEPLLKVSLKIDLLYFILNLCTAGAAGGFYNMFKNFDKVIGKILGKGYKEKYNNVMPFSADIYFDLVITGSINGGFHIYVDTTEERKQGSTSGSVEGELRVDLKAGGKIEIDVFIVQVEGEASASATTGIKVKIGMEDRIPQGEGVKAQFEVIFSGFKVSYVLKGKVGWFWTTSSSAEKMGEAKILDTTTLLSMSRVYLSEKAEDNHGWQFDNVGTSQTDWKNKSSKAGTGSVAPMGNTATEEEKNRLTQKKQ